MSFLFKPGGSVAGTAVDPISPGGVLIDPSEITQPGAWSPADAPAGYTLVTDGAGGWTLEPLSTSQRSIDLQLHHDLGVPSSGLRYLRFGDGLITSTSGFRLPDATARLKGIVIQLETTSVNDYQFDLLSDPAGRAAGPTVIAGTSIALPAGTLQVRNRGLDVAIGDVELGAWITRTAGAAGGSHLGQIAVVLEFEMAAP
jgi:hypothetical protein